MSGPKGQDHNLDLLHSLTQDILTSEMQKAERDEIKHGSYLMTKNRLEHYVFDFFKTVPLNTITEHRAILQKAKDLREKTFTDWELGKKV